MAVGVNQFHCTWKLFVRDSSQLCLIVNFDMKTLNGLKNLSGLKSLVSLFCTKFGKLIITSNDCFLKDITSHLSLATNAPRSGLRIEPMIKSENLNDRLNSQPKLEILYLKTGSGTDVAVISEKQKFLFNSFDFCNSGHSSLFYYRLYQTEKLKMSQHSLI